MTGISDSSVTGGVVCLGAGGTEWFGGCCVF